MYICIVGIVAARRSHLVLPTRFDSLPPIVETSPHGQKIKELQERDLLPPHDNCAR